MAATSFGFPRSRRLPAAEDFRRVFSEPTRASDAYLTLLARPNGTGEARLGFAISRKSIRRAVDRNRLKRLIREDFRLRRCWLAGLDVVVMARPAAAGAPRPVIKTSLDRHWKNLLQRWVASSSSSSGPTASC